MTISVIILTKNEERNIEECIKSVLWCDELIVIDDHSEDQTAKIAKESGALVYFHDLAKDFSAQRNFGLEKAHGEWILFIDADERVGDALREEIQTVIAARRNRFSGYNVSRQDVLFGKTLRHGETASLRFVRLGKKGSGLWKGAVHETWKIGGHIGTLKESLLHYPHQNVSEFLSEVDFYTDLRAEELYKKRVKSNWYSIILYTKGKFFRNYFLKLGLLDGIPGLISALMMSFHSFLVRGKLWLLWQKK